MDIRESLGNLIDRSGLTKTEVAKRACMSNIYLSKLLHNDNVNPSGGILHRLSLVFGVTMDTVAGVLDIGITLLSGVPEIESGHISSSGEITLELVISNEVCAKQSVIIKGKVTSWGFPL